MTQILKSFDPDNACSFNGMQKDTDPIISGCFEEIER